MCHSARVAHVRLLAMAGFGGRSLGILLAYAHFMHCRALAIGLLTLMGCGGTTARTVADSGQDPLRDDASTCVALGPEQLFEQIGLAFSSNVGRCDGLTPSLEAVASQVVQQQAAATLASLQKDIAAGTVVYDATKAFQRLAANCESPLLPVSCYAAIQGKLAAGEPCDATIDNCDHGSCHVPMCNGDGCPACVSSGVCVAWAAAGDSCGFEADCDPTSGLMCVAGNCRVRAAAANGAPCVGDGDCDPSGYCANGVCTPRPTVGATCGTDSLVFRNFDGTYSATGTYYAPPCGQGLACRGSVDYGGVQAGICQTPAAVGGPCNEPDPNFALQDNITGCEAGLACVQGSCQMPAPGTACGADCPSEAQFCDATQTCQSRKPLGASCQSANECLGTANADGRVDCVGGVCTAGGGCNGLLPQQF